MANRPLRWAGSLLGLGATTLAYAAFEAGWFTLRHYQVPLLPAGAAPLKLLHISDLHLLAGQQRKARWLARLADLEPDLVVSTGDSIGSAAALGLLGQALGPLLERPGAFVFGSNDYFTAKPKNPLSYLWRPSKAPHRRQPDLPHAELRQLMVEAGWLDLDNRRAQVQIGDLLVDLVGLADPHLNLDRLPPPGTSGISGLSGFGAGSPSGLSGLSGPGAGNPSGSPQPQAGGQVDQTKQPEDTGTRLFIGLVHAPYRAALRTLVDDGAQLVLAGHTHGGQVAVPLWGALVTNCDLPARMARGLHRLAGGPGGATGAAGPVTVSASSAVAASAVACTTPDAVAPFLHVSAGLGTSPYAPIRLACRPEATLLRLLPVQN